MIYCYRIAGGTATMTKICNGNDYGGILLVGKYKTDDDAKQACLTHYEKACKLAKNLNRKLPTLQWC